MVRIKDVAKAAGVAPSTVPLVLNKKGYVSVAMLYEQQYKMVLCCTHDNGANERNFIDMLRRRMMDGIILFTATMNMVGD